MGFRVWGSGFRLWGLGFRAQGNIMAVQAREPSRLKTKRPHFQLPKCKVLNGPSTGLVQPTKSRTRLLRQGSTKPKQVDKCILFM